MTLSYRFGIGTEVYTIFDNKVKKLTVSHVMCSIGKFQPQPEANYKLMEGNNELPGWFSESRLHKTKAALFRSV